MTVQHHVAMGISHRAVFIVDTVISICITYSFGCKVFLLPSNWHEDNFLHTFTGHGVFFVGGTDFFGTLVSWDSIFNSSI